jgi:hypothetical protein
MYLVETFIFDPEDLKITVCVYQANQDKEQN